MKKKIGGIIRDVLIIAALVGLDRLTKWLSVRNLMGKPAVPLIPNVLELTYVENQGAAFGMLQNQTLFFCIITPILIAVVILLRSKLPQGKKFWPARACTLMLIAGALGNFYDRAVKGYVVDMIYFKPIDFPVFNVADCYVTVGCILLALLMLFWKELGDGFFQVKDAIQSGKDKVEQTASEFQNTVSELNQLAHPGRSNEDGAEKPDGE